MRCFIFYVMLLELFLSESVLSQDIQSERRQPRCKNPIGKPGHTLVKSCNEKEVCTLNAKNKKPTWQTCDNPATGEELKAFEADVDSKLKNMSGSLNEINEQQIEINEQQIEIIRLLQDLIGPTTLLPSTIVTTEAPEWEKIYSLNTAGGLFANLDDAKKKNIDDPEADLFSRLYELDSMRNWEGVFHFKLCYPELASSTINFPCNEWTQTSNPLTESKITGFAAINLTWTRDGMNDLFHGLGLSSCCSSANLIDGNPFRDWWYSIGTIAYWGCATCVTGPGRTPVKMVELYVLFTPGG